MVTDTPGTPDGGDPTPKRKRRLRAALAADITNFSGRVSVSETRAFGNLSAILKVGKEELARHDGDLIGMPGDGLFALFESAVDAVQCALAIQHRLSRESNLGGMRLRIGIHVGDVLFEGDMPFGETLNIAARLESLADPGGILISGTMVDAVSARIQATFEDRGVPSLKNIPRRITTFAVHSADRLSDTDMRIARTPLDKTMQVPHATPSSPSAAEAAAAARQETPSAIPVQSRPSLIDRLKSEAGSVAAPATESSPAGQAAAVPPPEPPEAAAAAPPREPDPPRAPALALAPATATATVKPDSSGPPDRQPSVPPPATEIPAAAIEEITEALAVHLGPVARVMVTRKAKTARSPSDLIEKLALELASSDERARFRTRLIKLIGR